MDDQVEGLGCFMLIPNGMSDYNCKEERPSYRLPLAIVRWDMGEGFGLALYSIDQSFRAMNCTRCASTIIDIRITIVGECA